MKLLLLIIIPLLLLSYLYYSKRYESYQTERFLGFTKPKSTPPPPPTVDIHKPPTAKMDVDFDKPMIPEGGVKPMHINVQKAQAKPPVKTKSSNNQMTSLFNNMSCSFYAECPKGSKNMGNLGVNGSDVSLSCNGLVNVRAARAYAIIKNGSIEKIVVIDEGMGYQPNSRPQITIKGNGNGASADALIDDKGKLKVIHVIQGGSGYTESPEITIETPVNNNGCNLCCKLNNN